MRKLLSVAALIAVGLSGLNAATSPTKKTTATKKKTASKKGSKPAATASRKAGTRTAHPTRAGAASRKKPTESVSKRTPSSASRRHTTASRRGKRPVRRTTWRNRQLAPTPERYKEIQQALSAKGYLPAGQASGQWDDASAAALKKFQADQNLQASGKINSLSLIALGLGPKHDATSAQKSVNSITAPPAVTSGSSTGAETAPAKPE